MTKGRLPRIFSTTLHEARLVNSPESKLWTAVLICAVEDAIMPFFSRFYYNAYPRTAEYSPERIANARVRQLEAREEAYQWFFSEHYMTITDCLFEHPDGMRSLILRFINEQRALVDAGHPAPRLYSPRPQQISKQRKRRRVDTYKKLL